jgi:polysaccharide deacetylase family sporulation protein PdaB
MVKLKFAIFNKRVFSNRYARIASILILIAVIIFSSVIVFKTASEEVTGSHRKIPIYSVDLEDKLVSITFDCAWGADDIPGILDILKSRNVKASFFMVGQWAEKYPDKVKMIALDGHDLANHSYSHLRMGSLNKSKITEEIEKCGDVIENLSGKKPDLFRAPYGDYNKIVLEAAEELGYYTIQWNVDSLDWKKEMSRNDIIDRVLKLTNPGSIILFHNDTRYTAELLPEIIDSLRAMGYDFLPVSEMIIKDGYYIDFDGRQKKSK